MDTKTLASRPGPSRSWQRFSAASFVAAGAVFTLVAACSTSVNEVAAPATLTLSDGGTRTLPASCTDGQKDDEETDVDCGGGTCADCTGNKTCGGDGDCISAICSSGVCTFPNSHDGVKNGSETGVDCGGAKSNPKCPTGQGCEGGGDCVSQVCGSGMTCSAPTSTDMVQNGGETAVDCGGADTTGSDKAPPCGQGKGCTINLDCVSAACSPTAHTCVPATAMDGFQDGNETDVDCGGTGGAAPCTAGQMCKGNTDCDSSVCTGGTCIAASPTDRIKNGGETDVDCGGAGTMGSDGAPGCPTGKSCVAHTDCASQGCDDTMHCALAPSCTATAGGLSCGSGETGAAGAVHESCCTALPVPDGAGGQMLVDKYPVTAGRMRQFIDRNNGNIRAFVQANPPAGWNPGWDSWVPDDYDDNASDSWGGVYTEMGAYQCSAPGCAPYGGGNEGCTVKNEGARTYRFSDAINTTYFQDTQEYDASLTDEKALNCTPWLMFYAFCAWDGGHLETNDEFNAAWGPQAYPWGATPGPAGWTTSYPDAQSAMQHPAAPAGGDSTITNWDQNYWWPSEMVGVDYSIYLSAPGRFPRNAGPYGHMDLGGLSMELTATATASATPTDITVTWSKSGSWQGHPVGYVGFAFPATNKYIAATARCAR